MRGNSLLPLAALRAGAPDLACQAPTWSLWPELSFHTWDPPLPLLPDGIRLYDTHRNLDYRKTQGNTRTSQDSRYPTAKEKFPFKPDSEDKMHTDHGILSSKQADRALWFVKTNIPKSMHKEASFPLPPAPVTILV